MSLPRIRQFAVVGIVACKQVEMVYKPAWFDLGCWMFL